MKRKVRLFSRRLPDGSFELEAVGAPSLSVTASTAQRALKTFRKQYAEWDYWQARMAEVPWQENQRLIPVAVTVQPKQPVENPITITINLVVTHDSRSRRVLVAAPRVPKLQLVLASEEGLEDIAGPALAALLGKLKPLKLVSLDFAEPEELVEVVVSTSKKGTTEDDEEEEADDNDTPAKQGQSDDDVLELLGVNLTAAASLGRAFHREALVERIVKILAGEATANIVLVGPLDAGKTALVNEVARWIQAGKVPDSLVGRQLWHLSASNLIAGKKYVGEWEGQALKLVKQVRQGKQILFMGDPTEMLDSGRYEGSTRNVGGYLRPHLENGEVTVLCCCTEEVYAAQSRRDPSFMRAFRRIDVPPTDAPTTLAILHDVALELEKELGQSVGQDALAAMLELTRRFMPYRAFPGKAVRFLKEMLQDAASAHTPPTSGLGRTETVEAFARATGLPRFLLSDEVSLSAADLRSHFEDRLLGQPEAVEAITDLITVLKAGLNDPNKPLGSFFFVGPTGVGKTEMAKLLAEYLFGNRERMLRFDMGEYSAADAVPRLVGSAWRSEDEGELTRRVREQPFCVILLDELEKAHHDVFDVLLGVLGEGRLTDAGGLTTDFRNSIVVMTSNLGASRKEIRSLGFSTVEGASEEDASLRDHFRKEAESFFRPEFFNRIDRIVAFRALDPQAIRRLTQRELGKLLLREGIARRGLLVELDDAVIDHLAQRGFHPKYGARPLQREIERQIIVPLARLLTEQNADHRHLVRVSLVTGKVVMRLTSVLAPEDESAAITPAAPRPEADLKSLITLVRSLRIRIGEVDSGPVVQSLRRETSDLLARTREPTFWDDPTTSRAILQRVYEAERLCKRLDGLSHRSERLEDRISRFRGRRDRTVIADLQQELEQFTAELDFLEVELSGALNSEGRNIARLRLTSVSPGAESWVAQLLAMYEAWTRRKGYEWESNDPGPAGTPRKSQDGLHGFPEQYQVTICGTNVFRLLQGEDGLHKLDEGSGDQRDRCLARVTVWTTDAGETLNETTDSPDIGSELVRVYHKGRHRYVRDPRTGQRVNHVEAVLEEGRLDPFLLAFLRRSVPPEGNLS